MLSRHCDLSLIRALGDIRYPRSSLLDYMQSKSPIDSNVIKLLLQHDQDFVRNGNTALMLYLNSHTDAKLEIVKLLAPLTHINYYNPN